MKPLRVTELYGVRPHPGARLTGGLCARVFRVETPRLLDAYRALRLATGHPHPADPDLVCHALYPRRTREGWEITVSYRKRAESGRVAA